MHCQLVGYPRHQSTSVRAQGDSLVLEVDLTTDGTPDIDLDLEPHPVMEGEDSLRSPGHHQFRKSLRLGQNRVLDAVEWNVQQRRFDR